MYLNSFSVKIEGGSEQESGYVEVRHGTTYAIVMRNDRDVPCDATVTVDGKDIGTFRIDPHGKVRLERPANEAKKFTFFRRGSTEACKSGIHDVGYDDRGLVSVTFKPGRQCRPIKIVQPVICTCAACTLKRSGRIRRKGLSDCMDETICNNVDLTDGGECRGWDSLAGAEMQVPKNLEMGCTASADGEPTWSCDYVQEHCLGETRSRGRSASFSGTFQRKCKPTAERRSGITGMTGHSNQRFADVHALTDYDEDNVTTINLRLVAVSNEREDPTPLKSVMKTTPIPPAIYIKW